MGEDKLMLPNTELGAQIMMFLAVVPRGTMADISSWLEPLALHEPPYPNQAWAVVQHSDKVFQDTLDSMVEQCILAKNQRGNRYLLACMDWTADEKLNQEISFAGV